MKYPRVLYIGGAPMVGKTTIARFVSSRLQYGLISQVYYGYGFSPQKGYCPTDHVAHFVCRNNDSFFYKDQSPFRPRQRIPCLLGYPIHRFVSYLDDNRIASYPKGCEYRQKEDI